MSGHVFLQSFVSDYFTGLKEHHPLTPVCHILQHVGAQHRRLSRADSSESPGNGFSLHRVQSIRGFIQDEQVGFMQFAPGPKRPVDESPGTGCE